jgi:hypothetical protein
MMLIKMIEFLSNVNKLKIGVVCKNLSSSIDVRHICVGNYAEKVINMTICVNIYKICEKGQTKYRNSVANNKFK